MAESRSQMLFKEMLARDTAAEMRFRSHLSYADLNSLGKVDFLRFNGDKMKDWLFQIEQFFLVDRTPEELKVGIASSHFYDTAATWHQSIVHSIMWKHVRHNWWNYKLLLQVRFVDFVDDPIAELKQLQETSGIEEYHAKFELIKSRVNLSEAYLVSVYLEGLRFDTQMNVRMFRPQTIQHCFMLGRLYETAHPTSVIISTESDDYQKGVQPLNVSSKAAGISLSNIQVHNFSPKDNDFSEGKQSIQQESYVGVKKLLQQNEVICATETISQSQVLVPKMEHGLRFNNASPIVCEDSDSVVSCNDLFDHEVAVLVSYVKAKDETTSVTTNQVARQLFGKRSEAKDRLTLKKRRKGLKSWMFKYKQENKRLWRLHNHVLSFPNLCDRRFDRLGTTRKVKLFGGIDIVCVKNFVSLVVVGEVHEAPEINKTFRHKEKMGTKKQTKRVKSWMFKFRNKKSGAGHGEQSVYDRIVKEQLLKTSLVIQELMRNRKIKFPKHWMFKYKYEEGIKRLFSSNLCTNYYFAGWHCWKSKTLPHTRHQSIYKLGAKLLKNRRKKIWSILKGDCFTEDDQGYHETLSIWPLIRFKSWKFKFMNMKLQKTRPPIQNRLSHYMFLLVKHVAYAIHFSVGVGMAKIQSHLSLQNNRVWDPGGFIFEDATPW